MAKEDKNPWFGKAVGGVLGFAVGGPIGALIGIWIGSKFDKKQKRHTVALRYSGPNEAVAAAAAAAVTALGAKLAKSDGHISSKEIQAFRQIFNVAQEDVSRIGALWRSAGGTVAGYEPYARHLSLMFKKQPKMLSEIMANLKIVAEADGRIVEAERWILDDIAEIFGLGPHWEADPAIAGARGPSISLRAQNVEHAFREIFNSGIADVGGLVKGDAAETFGSRLHGFLANKLVRDLLTAGAFVTAYAAAMTWLPLGGYFQYSQIALAMTLGAVAAFIARLVLPKPRTLLDEIAATAKDAKVSPDEVVATIEETKAKIREIRRNAVGLEPRLGKRIDAICRSGQRIADALRTDPKDVGRSRPFLMHYLTATVDVVEQFAALNRKKGASARFDDVFAKLEPLLADIEGMFQTHYERNLADDALELDVNIDSLQKMIRAEAR